MEGRAQCEEAGDYNDAVVRGETGEVIRETGMGGNEGFPTGLFTLEPAGSVNAFAIVCQSLAV